MSVLMPSNLFLLGTKYPELPKTDFVFNKKFLLKNVSYKWEKKFKIGKHCQRANQKKIFDQLNARTITKKLEFFECEDGCVEDNEEDDPAAQFLGIQKKTSNRSY